MTEEENFEECFWEVTTYVLRYIQSRKVEDGRLDLGDRLYFNLLFSEIIMKEKKAK